MYDSEIQEVSYFELEGIGYKDYAPAPSVFRSSSRSMKDIKLMTDRKGHGQGDAGKVLQACYLILIGVSVGLLVGLSLSPVLGGILTSMLTVILAVISTLVGIKQPDEKSEETSTNKPPKFNPPIINLLPLAAFCLSLTCGSCAGLFIRSNDLLGANPDLYFGRWKGRGISDADLRGRILGSIAGLNPVEVKADNGGAVERTKEDPKPEPKKDENHEGKKTEHTVFTQHIGAGLYDFVGPSDKCAEINAQSDPGLRKQKIVAMYAQYQPKLAVMVNRCVTEECVALALENLCPSKH